MSTYTVANSFAVQPGDPLLAVLMLAFVAYVVWRFLKGDK